MHQFTVMIEGTPANTAPTQRALNSLQEFLHLAYDAPDHVTDAVDLPIAFGGLLEDRFGNEWQLDGFSSCFQIMGNIEYDAYVDQDADPDWIVCIYPDGSIVYTDVCEQPHLYYSRTV